MKGLKALVGAGLLCLSLAGCKGRDEPIKPGDADEPVRTESIQSEPNSLRLNYSGTWVQGEIDGIDILYTLDGNAVLLRLKDNASRVVIDDGGRHDAIDGNLNYLCLTGPGFQKYAFFKDNGENAQDEWYGLTEDEAKKLRGWGNAKLYKIHKLCQAIFGDKLKIPYKESEISKKGLDEFLRDFDF